MALLTRYDPFREMISLRDAMDRLFEQSFVRPIRGVAGTSVLNVPMDVYETEQGYQVTVLLPGIKPEDINLLVEQNRLSIKGQYQTPVEEGKQVNWLVREIGSGSFERTITFDRPIDPDKVEAQYEHGMLTISLPVSETSLPKRISISADQPKQVTAGNETH
jgi:HSP20 family protein